MLLLRTIKRRFFANRKFNNYVVYAIGEMVLVIAGILIALQISVWSEDRKEREVLNEYLDIIARNISEDLDQIDSIRSQRLAALHTSRRSLDTSFLKTSYSVADIHYLGAALAQSRRQYYFSANTSGYEALKSSGVLNSLKNRRVENLLFEYYQTVARINNAERDHNEYVKMLSLQLMSDKTRLPTTLFYFHSPQFLSRTEFEELQPKFKSLIQDPVTLALHQQSILQALFQDYERLISIGRWFIEGTASKTGILDRRARAPEPHDPNGDIGYASVMERGELAGHAYAMNLAPIESAFFLSLSSTARVDDSLRVIFPGGDAWALLYIYVGAPEFSTERHSKDFSAYDTLRLELKGALGGEVVTVVAKDRDDADDGGQATVDLTLTDEWQTYDIPLSRFTDADLTKLSLVTGFVVLEERESFYVRTIRFVDAR